MFRVQQALFPGVIMAVLSVIVLTNLISQAGVAQAFSGPNAINAPADVEAAAVQTTVHTTDPDSPNSCSLSARYPDAIRQWCSLIEKYAQKYGLDPALISAVMLQESGGDSSAYSASGAVGLMQVMPRDGLAAGFMCSGRPCFSARPAMADLYDPEFNISYGVRMLAGLNQKYGSVRDALKAYGPMDTGYAYADKVLSIFQNYN
ncbi:MAG TPA: transglycosylase SLT domain-containing protein [Anaerolineaceae bacterium]|jgi:soluble lytic murein transglycosylase-like protein